MFCSSGFAEGNETKDGVSFLVIGSLGVYCYEHAYGLLTLCPSGEKETATQGECGCLTSKSLVAALSA